MHNRETEPIQSGEVEPGVFVGRRGLLASLTAAMALTPWARWSAARAEALSDGTLSYDAFLKEVIPVARGLVGDKSKRGQDRYLLTLASFAARLVDVPVPEMKDSGQGSGPGTFIGANASADLFTVLHWRMEPHTEIRTHAHTYGNVVTVCLEGEAEVRNYEVIGTRDYAASAPFKVRRTRSQWLTTGAANLVNLERDYIHGFKTGSSGARGLDITTRLLSKTRTPYLIIDAPGKDEISEGHWQLA